VRTSNGTSSDQPPLSDLTFVSDSAEVNRVTPGDKDDQSRFQTTPVISESISKPGICAAAAAKGDISGGGNSGEGLPAASGGEPRRRKLGAASWSPVNGTIACGGGGVNKSRNSGGVDFKIPVSPTRSRSVTIGKLRSGENAHKVGTVIFTSAYCA
jgi:hypothetical protein